MPIYEYRCENGHTFEVMQSMSDDPLTTCTTCGAPVQRVFHPVAVHFKGSGFYTTDYGRKTKAPTGGSSDEGSAGADSKTDSSSTSDKGGKSSSDSGKSGSGSSASGAGSS
jgi:putative FmdB family regulatory protein